jgi:phage protein D
LDVCYIATPTEKVKINRIGLLLKGHSNNPYVSDKEKTLRAEWQELKARATREKDVKTIDAAAEKRSEQVSEMEKSEPKILRDLRAGLIRHCAVSQLLDPWYMNFNTHGTGAANINDQQSKVEKGHAHHLHITIREPGII